MKRSAAKIPVPPLLGVRGLLALLLLGQSAFAQAPAHLTVTLPDAGTYSYWVQGRAGGIFQLPRTVSGQSELKLLKPVSAGDTLYLLDAHSGAIASHPISAADATVPVTLAVSDFKPQGQMAAQSAPPAVAPAPGAPAEPPRRGGMGRLLTDLLGLVLAAAIAWAIVHLIRTRGEPLLVLARRAGVSVPDPSAQHDNIEATVIYTPAPRGVEKVPDEAGQAPETATGTFARPGPAVNLADSTTLASAGIPQMVATQGIAAGSIFALTREGISIGRDGGNSIVLAENTVSRQHARVVREAGGQVILTDEGSANGVYVNGMRVQRAALKAGDEIKIGDNFFRFEA